MKSDAPNVPFYYEYPFRININTNQIIIGRSKFLSFNYNSINDENNSYKKILYPEHINIFHIVFPCIGNKDLNKKLLLIFIINLYKILKIFFRIYFSNLLFFV